MKIKALVDTVIKKSEDSASSLSEAEKFNLPEGESIEITGASTAAAGHIRVNLAEAVHGLNQWFAFRRHVDIIGSPTFSLQGTDSLGRVVNDSVVDVATRLLGGIKPNYWGRYFSGVDYGGAGEYFGSREHQTLRRNNIRVLPVARYTTQVGKGEAEGARDGFDQANDFVKSFGETYLESQGREYYLFLDVEPSNPLSSPYYKGWSQAVAKISRRVDILPCVYLNPADSTTIDSLRRAMNNGSECHGLWIASYIASRSPSIPLPPQDFDDTIASRVGSVNAPVLFWQYAGDIGPSEDFDFNVGNPAISNEQILSRLILPPDV